MKKFLLSILLFLSFSIFAQNNQYRCISQELLNKKIQDDSQFKSVHEGLENFISEYIKHAQVERTGSRFVYVIPVVFHILHNYGPENISKAQIIDCIDALNEDFRKRNADTINIVPSFQSIATDAEIEFRFANLDPNGNCTDGIERIVHDPFLIDDSDKINQWPNNMYLNFWTGATLLNAFVASYAGVPGGPNNLDGIVIRSDYVGRIGTSNPTNSRRLTHEMGHFFTLYHVWGNSNAPGLSCGDDSIADTPPSIGWDHCDLAGSVCNPPVVENVQNFMENSFCECMFTQGQATRMHASLNSPVNGRNNLWTTNNLVLTGTDGSPITICSPHADFYATPLNVCVNTPISFYDLSWNTTVTNWNWTFPGGSPSSLTDSNPTVTYSNAGYYNATLITTSANGSDTVTRNAFIRVSGPPSQLMPYTNDFENVLSFPGVDGWTESSDTVASTMITRVSNANTTIGGTFSIKANNFNSPAGQVDSWVSQGIDFTNVSFPIIMTFKVSNAQRTSTTDDRLRIFYSINCGKTWVSSYIKHGATLATAGIVSSDFIPSSTQWRQETVNLNPVQHQANVHFKFENTSDHGNNTYIDDINITGTINGIGETENLLNDFELYPNPTNGISTLSFQLTKSSTVNIEVKNILGQRLSSIKERKINSGLNKFELPAFPSGIYFVDVIVDEIHHVKKLIVSNE